MTDVVTLSRHGNIGVIALNNPPVNALSHAVRSRLCALLADAFADASIRALVICCEGRTFVAGADIREFGKPPLAPDLPEVVELVDSARRPVIAALHGTVLGGGLELALACHFRVAAASTKFGFPEVTLGILPGAGGTQRLPRLLGVRAALDMIVRGKPIGAPKAHALGLIDELADGDVRVAALAFAERVLSEQRPSRKTSELTATLEAPSLFDEYEAAVEREYRGLLAPLRCVQAVRAAVELPFAEGLQRERELFAELIASPQSKAQRHAFFGEREVAKVPGLSEATPTRQIDSVAVTGANAMGVEIALCFADARIPVTWLGLTQQELDRGFSTLRGHYAEAVAKGTLKQADADERLQRIRPTLSYAALQDADLVLEASSADIAAAREVFAELDAACKPTSIFASAAPALNIDELAEATKRPQNVLGMHFFGPGNATRLLANVRSERTEPEVCATAMKLGRALGKVPVLVRACDGFVGDRMRAQQSREALFLLEEGALPEQVDGVLRRFGLAMGPFEAGERARTARPDPAIEALLLEHSKERGIARRTISDQEIIERCIYSVINEGARVLEAGCVARPLDIDMIWIHGYGFPAHRGGPMFYADQIGLELVYEAVLRYEAQVGAEYWAPAPLLERLVKEKKGFYVAP